MKSTILYIIIHLFAFFNISQAQKYTPLIALSCPLFVQHDKPFQLSVMITYMDNGISLPVPLGSVKFEYPNGKQVVQHVEHGQASHTELYFGTEDVNNVQMTVSYFDGEPLFGPTLESCIVPVKRIDETIVDSHLPNEQWKQGFQYLVRGNGQLSKREAEMQVLNPEECKRDGQANTVWAIGKTCNIQYSLKPSLAFNGVTKIVSYPIRQRSPQLIIRGTTSNPAIIFVPVIFVVLTLLVVGVVYVKTRQSRPLIKDYPTIRYPQDTMIVVGV